MPFAKRFLFFILVCLWLILHVETVHAMTALSKQDFLPPEAAFRFSASLKDPQTAQIHFDIADGYYLYRERFNFQAQGATLGQPSMPPGRLTYDPTFEKQMQTYHQRVTILLPIHILDTHTPFTLQVQSQGCAQAGLCYPPMTSRIVLSAKDTPLPEQTLEKWPDKQRDTTVTDALLGTKTMGSPTRQAPSDTGKITVALHSGKWGVILPLFFLLGLGLALTPCVLPMVPILSAMIVGQSPPPRPSRALGLSLAYVLGMSVIYTLLGMLAGWLGEGLAASMQNPWVLSLFGLLMVGLALSMFDLYTLSLPSQWQTTLAHYINYFHPGRFVASFGMGALSSLIVSPCVVAPMAAILLYISQTRDIVLGGGALFTLSIGMGIPLLLVGVFSGTLLPRAGAWMNAVKTFFGVLMLGVALQLISPIIPPSLSLLAWSLLFSGYGAYLMWGQAPYASHWIVNLLALLLITHGVVQWISLTTGAREAFSPLSHFTAQRTTALTFTPVASMTALNAALSQARTEGKITLLEIYADWCVACKAMEKQTFTDPRIQSALADKILLRMDVTANNTEDKKMLKSFGLFGPPALLFFDRSAEEMSAWRVIGYQDADPFLALLKQLKIAVGDLKDSI